MRCTFSSAGKAELNAGTDRQLMAHVHDLAREAGAATLELEVETGNPAALAAHGRQGLAIARTSPEVWHEAQGRSFALHRMVKPVG